MKVFLTVLVSTWIATTAGAAPLVPAGVQRAHQAYLNGNGKTLLTEIKSVLEQSPNSAVQKNMLDLYSAAQKNGVLKDLEPNWKLPKEITYAGVESIRRYRVESGRIVYAINASVDVAKGATLEQLQVIRYPNQVILDKAAGIGDWSSSQNSDDESINNWGGSPSTISANEEGLYLLNIQVQGQPPIQGWFILANKNSSASPVVIAPKVGQVFVDDQPLFKWTAFHSPEYKSGENVNIAMRISQAVDQEPEVAYWRMKDPKSSSYKFGDKSAAKEFRGPSSLSPGDYQLTLTYRETEMFGDLQIRRASSTKIPFSVRQ
jgi:hypothetical protein